MDPDNVQATDLMCDYCLKPWNEEGVFVEGHQGSIICDGCLRVAHAEIVEQGRDSGVDGYKCTLCLEKRADRAWQSPANEKALICERCILLSIEAIEDDPDVEWDAAG
jgi:hypothetical protein